jgi:cytochrome bd-type quinol oxidase subunit 2
MTFRGAHPTVMPLAGGLSPAARRTVRAAGILTGVLAVALGLHDLGTLGGPQLDEFFNVWVYTGIEVLVCVLVLTRAFTIRQDRGAWLALGIGIAFYTAGDIYYALVLENAASVPTPSPADAGYLLF